MINPLEFCFLWVAVAIVHAAGAANAQNPTDVSGVASPKPFGAVGTNSPGDWEFRADHSDEFDDNQIDRTKWNVDSNDFGPWSWEPKNVTQRDGAMQLQMVRSDHKRGQQTLHYTSGMARNDKTITYGYFEARIKGCSRYPGACPSFWLYSIGPQNRFQASDGETVAYSEIDIVELQQSEFDFETKKHFPVNRIDCNLHTTLIQDGKRVWARPHNRPALCENHFDSPWDPREDYHVYAVENSKAWIVWYIDGKQVAKKPNLYWHLPMHVTLSLGLRYPFVAYKGGDRVPVPEETTAEGFPTTMSVDYVRVWQKPSDAAKKSPTDWTKAEYIAKEKVNWKKNAWPWDQRKVESNFDEIDTNKDGVASGKERQDWYAKKTADAKKSASAEQPNTTYALSAWAKSPKTNERDLWFNAFLGVKGHGGEETRARFFFPYYRQKSLQFTTGPSATTAVIYFTNIPHGETANVDDVELVEISH